MAAGIEDPPLNVVRPACIDADMRSPMTTAASSSKEPQGGRHSPQEPQQLQLALGGGGGVAVDAFRSSSALANLVTRERLQLAGHYELVVDDVTGEDLMVGEGRDEGSIREVSPRFSQHLYESPGGGLGLKPVQRRGALDMFGCVRGEVQGGTVQGCGRRRLGRSGV